MKMRDVAVVTINIGDKFQEVGKHTIPLISAYADRINSDFIIIDKLPSTVVDREYAAYWAKFELFNLLDTYSRIIYIDLDAVVYPQCPNLFEIVPENAFGAMFESDYGISFSDEILNIQSNLGEIFWRNDYFNVGVMVISQHHKEAFRPRNDDFEGSLYPEQTQINYNVKKLGFEIYHLPHKFNHMGFLKLEGVDNIDNRDESYISHFAGLPQKWREIFIKDDVARYFSGQKAANLEERQRLLLNVYTKAEMYREIRSWKMSLTKNEDLWMT